jgi:hypothetical protein
MQLILSKVIKAILKCVPKFLSSVKSWSLCVKCVLPDAVKFSVRELCLDR